MEVFDPRHTLELATKQSYSDNVFLFVPNLIGARRSPSRLSSAKTLIGSV
jgi:hypothetical protein